MDKEAPAAEIISYHIAGMIEFSPYMVAAVAVSLLLGWFLHKRLDKK